MTGGFQSVRPVPQHADLLGVARSCQKCLPCCSARKIQRTEQLPARSRHIDPSVDLTPQKNERNRRWVLHLLDIELGVTIPTAKNVCAFFLLEAELDMHWISTHMNNYEDDRLKWGHTQTHRPYLMDLIWYEYIVPSSIAVVDGHISFPSEQFSQIDHVCMLDAFVTLCLDNPEITQLWVHVSARVSNSPRPI